MNENTMNHWLSFAFGLVFDEHLTPYISNSLEGSIDQPRNEKITWNHGAFCDTRRAGWGWRRLVCMESSAVPMNELPVIGSLRLRTDFWDRHGAKKLQLARKECMANVCLDVLKSDFGERLWLFRHNFIVNR